MSSKKDSAFYDSSSLPYTTNMERKVNSDCFPCRNDYQHSKKKEQLKTKSCDNFPRDADSQNTIKNPDLYHYMNNLENTEAICCNDNSRLNCYCQKVQIPSDPRGSKHIFFALQFFRNCS